MGQQKVKKAKEEDLVAEAEKVLSEQKEVKEKQQVAEVEAEKAGESKPKKIEIKKKRQRSARYLQARESFDAKNYYPLEEALEILKKASYSKFVGTIELHISLTAKKGKKELENIRGMLQLPYGTGKATKVEILTEDKILEIAKDKKVDFDVAIATPELMPKLAKIAKILGPQGKMPNPKFGTVTSKPKEVKEQFEKGKIEYRADASNTIHLPVGKVDWETKKLDENIKTMLSVLPVSRIKSVVISASMSPGVKVRV